MSSERYKMHYKIVQTMENTALYHVLSNTSQDGLELMQQVRIQLAFAAFAVRFMEWYRRIAPS